MDDTTRLIIEFLAVIVFIFLGVRSGGIGLGLWGGVGVLFFAFIFQEPPGEPPISAMLIIIAVISAAAAMQAAGGTDYLVRIASRIIRSNPSQVTIIAPLVSFAFTMGAGTSNIFFSLIPVIEDVAYQNNIRPERPLAASTVASGLGITASPVSAAMAVMVGLMEPLGFSLTEMLIIIVPATLVAIVAGSLLQNRLGKELKDDPEYQRRLAAGEIEAKSVDVDTPLPPRAALSAFIFLAGVGAIVLFGLFEQLRPVYEVGPEEFEQLDVTTTIQMVMLTVATIILMTCAIEPGQILKAPIFLAGMTGMIALFGIAWLADTFVQANIDYITELLSDLVTAIPFLFAVALFAMAALTTSQSATTKSIVPIGIAIGLPAQLMIAMWPSLIGVFFLPANGTQLAAVAADRTGSTKIGNAVVNHSFQPNTIFMWVVTVIVGIIIAVIIHGTAAADSDLSESPPAEVTATEEAPAEETPAAETPAAEESTPEEAAPTEEAVATEAPAEEAAPTEEAAAPTEVPVETPAPAVTP
jgi:anaerobic C4-dicarboxylate transporter DcuA/anaerobic C4-dicarboxylate transporter DcuB